MKETRTTPLGLGIFWGFVLLFVLWGTLKISMAFDAGHDIFVWREALLDELAHPFRLRIAQNTPAFMLVGCALWASAMASSFHTLGKWRRYAEHGTAEWGNPKALRRKWEDKSAKMAPDGTLLCDPNLILSKNMRLATRKLDLHHKNKNLLVIGGSGTRKSTGLVMPNIMQCSGSFVVTDPSGELVRSCGPLLEERGYAVKVLNLVDMGKSHRMNPFWYIETEEDISRLATSFIQNTEDKNKRGGDPFWTDSLKLLLMSLIALIWEECPKDEQNFGTLTRLVMLAEIEGEQMGSKSLLDRIFDDLGEKNEESLAFQNYLLFKGAPPKTRASVVITLSSRLSVFTLPRARRLTSTDELELDKMGDRKQAVFCVIPQAETTFNFLVGLVYTSLFSVLYRRGEKQAAIGGSNKLPVSVQVLMDEFANIAQPDSFEQILATCRKYDISIGIFLQNITQLKKLYEKDWESIAGNCDTLIYLGGNEAFTWRYISDALDKETINVSTWGKTGANSSINQQITGRDLLTKGEVRALPDGKCIVLVRGESGVLDDKFDLHSHPNFKRIDLYGSYMPAIPKCEQAPQAEEAGAATSFSDGDLEDLVDEDVREAVRAQYENAGGVADREEGWEVGEGTKEEAKAEEAEAEEHDRKAGGEKPKIEEWEKNPAKNECARAAARVPKGRAAHKKAGDSKKDA